MTVLLTGGTGYIGSHTTVELLQSGYHVVILDNLCNSKKVVVERIEKISGHKVPFFKVDLLNKEALEEIFKSYDISAVIHFAAFKVLAESIIKPLDYYRNNVTGSINLFEMMIKYKVKSLVFSSTAAVYGNRCISPINEESLSNTDNPYGRTKLITEQLIHDVYASESRFNAIILRYFNPIGSHHSGIIGEDATKNADNLLPYVAKAALGKISYLTVYGNDYETEDGTGVRDFIHVVDLAKGHIKALEKLQDNKGVFTYNLGCGKGHSVYEVIRSFEKVSGKKIDYRIAPRRKGDLASVFADPSKAERELRWKAQYNLEDMCRDLWNWYSKNPDGYQ